MAIALFYVAVLRDLPEINNLQDYRPNLITRVLDVDGNEIASFAKERRVIIPIEQVPKHVVDAFIAAEDGSFYEHKGLDYGGILRAAFTNIMEGRKAQGASTITQQVAKTFLLTPERSYTRKLKDMVLARRIEERLSKNDILYLYLNQIYFGAGAYGIEEAAQTYFGKSARDLQVHEAALIAGLVPRPAEWNPHTDPETARRKQLLVLHRMVEQGFLKPEEHDYWAAQPLVYAQIRWQERDSASAFFVEEVRRYLMDSFGGDEVLTGGLTVHTTLDVGQQLDAWRAVRRGLRDHDKRMGYRGPLKNVAEKDWPAALAEIDANNASVLVPSEEPAYQALVVALDDKSATVALGAAADAKHALPLSDVAWALPPDPRRDGMNARASKVGQVLHKGDLVLVEKSADGKTVSLYQRPLAEGALLSVDLEKGELKTVVGGYSFASSEFDRALQSKRQPGSAFKPIVYAAALARGFTPATIVHDTAVVYDDGADGSEWKPENYTEDFYGPITLRTALAKSRNAATIRVLSEIGLAPVRDMAKALGIESPMEMNLGLALGNSEVTLAELVRAYTAFATGGRIIDPVFVLEVRDRTGKVLAENVHLLTGRAALPTPPVGQGGGEESAGPSNSDLDKVMQKLREEVETKTTPGLPEGYTVDPVDAYLMTDMLRAVVEEGTGTKVKALGRPVAGKTGTTNDLHDAWFIGYTPEIAAGVWIGYDSARNLGRNETGGRTAAPVFLDYMKGALAERPTQEFAVPEGVVFARVDRGTGLLAPAGDEKAIFLPFREGSAPTEVSPTEDGTGGPARPLRVD